MCNFFASINWLGSIQTLAVLFGAYVAYQALNTWKHQSKAQKQTEFLDELTDSVHEYIQALSQPVQFLKFIHIGFDCHKNLPTNIKHEYSHIIAYITARGTESADKMWGYINDSNHLVAKIEALVARGQVYSFNKYDKCQKSIDMLLWQHQRLQVVASIIGSPTMNWDHPDVIEGIKNMLTVQPDDIEEHIKKQNVEYLEFFQENYQEIYKDT